MDRIGKRDGESTQSDCGFRRLTVWRRSKDLAVRVYRLCREGPIAKDFSLRDQIQRSAVSVCSNIAEGDERESDRDSIRFFLIAKGSLAELATQVEIASEIGYFSASVTSDVLPECREIARMIGGLVKARSGGAMIRRAQVSRTQSL